jgi:hypothetical protein
MDVLVSLGTTISFVYSAGATIYALLHPEFARMALIETLWCRYGSCTSDVKCTTHAIGALYHQQCMHSSIQQLC